MPHSDAGHEFLTDEQTLRNIHLYIRKLSTTLNFGNDTLEQLPTVKKSLEATTDISLVLYDLLDGGYTQPDYDCINEGDWRDARLGTLNELCMRFRDEGA